MKQSLYSLLEKLNLSLKMKLIIAFALLVGLISLFIVLIFPVQFEKQAIKSVTDKAESISQMTAFSISSALYFDDIETIDAVLRSTRQNEDVFYLVVLDISGNIVSGFNKETPYYIEFSDRQNEKISEDGKILNKKTKIVINEEEIGQLFMGISLDGVKERVRKSAATIILISLIIFVIGIFVVYGISKMVTLPLEKMVTTVNHITSGDLSKRTNINSKDEVGNLARSFNIMVENLEKNTSKLEQEIQTRIEAEQIIKSSLNEKEVLLKEIHHRVKNNLQIISSLLYLQSKNIKNEDTLALFTDSQSRVKSMALIHEKLYQGSDLASINFVDYIKNLTTYLVRTYRVEGKGINVQYQVDEIELDLDTAVPCGLIINELITNALKYAFPKNGKPVTDTEWTPEISVGFVKNNSSGYCLTIADNGCGIPEDFDLSKAKSLGLKLVSSLVSQLKGTVEIESSEGAVFKIKF